MGIPGSTQYRADIDGLRAVAVLLVVFFHAFPGRIKGGFIGVDVFFVISGFLISSIIFEGLAQDRFSFIEFYGRRVRRIFPALLVVLTASFTFGWFALLSDEYKDFGMQVAGSAGFVSNFVLWGQAGYFDSAQETKPLLHLWSLAIEEQFYVLWPFLLWLSWKLKHYRLAPIAIVGITSFVLNVALISQDVVAGFYSPVTRFWELLVGAFAAFLTLRRRSDNTASGNENFSAKQLQK